MSEQALNSVGLHQSKKMKEISVHTRVMVWCTLSFSANHFWRDAQGKQAYLRHPHRHVFHIRASKQVLELDRDVEFIALKEEIQKYVDRVYTDKTFEYSCEMIAQDILMQFDLHEVTVSEDQENGAVVTRLYG